MCIFPLIFSSGKSVMSGFCVCLLFLFWSLRLIFFAIRAWPRLIIIPTISLEQHQQMTVGMLGTEYFLYKVDGAKLPLVSMLGRDKRCRKVGRDFQIPGTLRWIMKFLCEDTCTHTLTHAHRLYELWGGWGVCVLCMMWDTDVFSYGFFFPAVFLPHTQTLRSSSHHHRFLCECLNGLS